MNRRDNWIVGLSCTPAGDRALYRQYPAEFCRYCLEEQKCEVARRPFGCEYWDDFWKEYGGRKSR